MVAVQLLSGFFIQLHGSACLRLLSKAALASFDINSPLGISMLDRAAGACNMHSIHYSVRDVFLK